MTKQINTNNKNNGGKTMKKGARVWQFAKALGITCKKALETLNKMGINKHHHFCFIAQEEFMNAMKANNRTTINENNKQTQGNKGGNTMATNKRYFIHTERMDNHENTLAMHFYKDMAAMCGMEGKQIYFGFGEARVSDEMSYYDACAQAYNACREGGTIYLFEYDTPVYGDVNIHDFDYWIEYLDEVQSMFCNKETAKVWYDAISNNETMVHNNEHNFAGCINEVVFHKDSNVRLVAKMECKNEEQCRFVYNYIADKYNMTVSHDGNVNKNNATISDFTFAEWRKISKFIKANGNGVVVSKKTGLAITKEQIATIKNWVASHAA